MPAGAWPQDISRCVLDGGTRIVTERMPSMRSVAVGVWVPVGARDEPAELAGASHFLEHLLFKGTPTRTARQLANEIEEVGGDMNAYTSREHTAYHVRVPAEALDRAVDILVDVITRPALRPADVDAERTVILEELAAAEDTPEDVAHRLVAEAVFPDHPLGREVLGDRATLASMTADDIAGFFRSWYHPAAMVVAAAGALDHHRFADMVAERLETRPGPAPVPVRRAPGTPPEPHRIAVRATEQTQVALGLRGLAATDPDRHALAVCNEILGGGTSSRLFQHIREERGLAYAVYSSHSAYTDAGLWSLHAGCAPERAAEVAGLLTGELASLADGCTPAELAVAKGALRGSVVLGLEDPAARMARLGVTELIWGRPVTIDEQLDALAAVEADDVARVAGRLVGGPRALIAVGPNAAELVNVTAPAG